MHTIADLIRKKTHMATLVKLLHRITCELRPRRENITCIALCGDEVLLVDYNHGHGWNFPTDIVSDHESPIDATHRGMKQRLGIQIPKTILLGRLYCKFGCLREIMYCFLSHVPSKEHKIIDPRAKNAQWFHVDHLPDTMSEFAREVVDEWFHAL